MDYITSLLLDMGFGWDPSSEGSFSDQRLAKGHRIHPPQNCSGVLEFGFIHYNQ